MGTDEIKNSGTDEKLRVDPMRRNHPETGIYTRAYLMSGEVASVDIVHLDAASLLKWLRSRGGENKWAENCFGVLLGHEQLVE